MRYCGAMPSGSVISRRCARCDRAGKGSRAGNRKRGQVDLSPLCLSFGAVRRSHGRERNRSRQLHVCCAPANASAPGRLNHQYLVDQWQRAFALGGVAYAESKFAMSGFGTAVANEDGKHGIRVTTIYPGEVDTRHLLKQQSCLRPSHRQKSEHRFIARIESEFCGQRIVVKTCDRATRQSQRSGHKH